MGGELGFIAWFGGIVTVVALAGFTFGGFRDGRRKKKERAFEASLSFADQVVAHSRSERGRVIEAQGRAGAAEFQASLDLAEAQLVMRWELDRAPWPLQVLDEARKLEPVGLSEAARALHQTLIALSGCVLVGRTVTHAAHVAGGVADVQITTLGTQLDTAVRALQREMDAAWELAALVLEAEAAPSEVRVDALRALWGHGSERAQAALVGALESEDHGVALAAAGRFADDAPSAAIRVAERVLTEASAEGRFDQAARLLARVAAAPTVDAVLLRAAESGGPRREWALRALARERRSRGEVLPEGGLQVFEDPAEAGLSHVEREGALSETEEAG